MEKEIFKEICIEGRPILAQGVHGTVYQMDGPWVVKLYDPSITPDQVEKEWRLSREASLLGLPAVRTGEAVRCQDRYGIVFEEIQGDTLGHAIAAAPERLSEFAKSYAALARRLHETHTKEPVFPSLKTELTKRLPLLAPFCTEGDLELLEDLVGCLPECDSLIHGDLHPGNLMLRGAELVLIDLPELMRGSPVWDLAAIYRDLIIGPLFPTPALEKSIGMKADLIARTGKAFFAAYTGLQEEALENDMASLLPVYAMNTVFNLGGAQDRDEEACQRIIPMLMREVVHKQEGLLREMLMKKEGE